MESLSFFVLSLTVVMVEKRAREMKPSGFGRREKMIGAWCSREENDIVFECDMLIWLNLYRLGHWTFRPFDRLFLEFCFD